VYEICVSELPLKLGPEILTFSYRIFYVLLTVHLYLLCNENQPDVLFILNLFLQSTSTVSGVYSILPIIRRYSRYMYSNWYVLYI
jgi:hypothetical protein